MHLVLFGMQNRTFGPGSHRHHDAGAAGQPRLDENPEHVVQEAQRQQDGSHLRHRPGGGDVFHRRTDGQTPRTRSTTGRARAEGCRLAWQFYL
jgi:hypothetical protein